MAARVHHVAQSLPPLFKGHDCFVLYHSHISKFCAIPFQNHPPSSFPRNFHTTHFTYSSKPTFASSQLEVSKELSTQDEPPEEWINTIDNHNDYWVRELQDSCGFGNLTGQIAYRTCYPTSSPPCSEARWSQFKAAFEKLALKQWEHIATIEAVGIDPTNERSRWKTFWVEDESLGEVEILEEKDGLDELRRRFDWEGRMSWPKPSALIHPGATCNYFLMLDAQIIASVLEGPAKGEIPFVYVLAPVWPDNGEWPEVLTEEETAEREAEKGYYKVAVELLGEYWCMVGSGMRGWDQMVMEEKDGSPSREVGCAVIWDESHTANKS